LKGKSREVVNGGKEKVRVEGTQHMDKRGAFTVKRAYFTVEGGL